MDRKELRGEINRVLIIVASAAVVVVLAIVALAAVGQQEAQRQAKIEAERRHREVMWQAEAALKGYKVP